MTDFLSGTIATLIVDEVFDGNRLDLRIVAGAARHGIPTTLIGDPWQALYGFRGAEPHLVPSLINQLEFAPYPITESFRFETVEMQGLAANLRLGHGVTLDAGDAATCNVVLACEWSRLWECSDDVLPYSFGQPGNRIDAAIALLLDHIVTRQFEPLSTFVADAAALLGLDLDTLRNEGSAHLAPVVETLAGGTEDDAKAALALLRAKLTEMGSVNITNLTAANMADRYARLVGIARRLDRPKLTPGLTVHQAKGREWPQVGVALTNGEVQRLATGLSQANELDRTLYVALTRAKVGTTRLVA